MTQFSYFNRNYSYYPKTCRNLRNKTEIPNVGIYIRINHFSEKRKFASYQTDSNYIKLELNHFLEFRMYWLTIHTSIAVPVVVPYHLKYAFTPVFTYSTNSLVIVGKVSRKLTGKRTKTVRFIAKPRYYQSFYSLPSMELVKWVQWLWYWAGPYFKLVITNHHDGHLRWQSAQREYLWVFLESTGNVSQDMLYLIQILYNLILKKKIFSPIQ